MVLADVWQGLGQDLGLVTWGDVVERMFVGGVGHGGWLVWSEAAL